MRKYNVTYYYLASGMEGKADVYDYGTIEANSPDEAKDLVIAKHNADDNEVSKAWVRGCLIANLVTVETERSDLVGFEGNAGEGKFFFGPSEPTHFYMCLDNSCPAGFVFTHGDKKKLITCEELAKLLWP